MTDYTSTPWRVFTSPDGLKLVGIGAEDGAGILDAGFGVWSWMDKEGIANAELVVRAVNSHQANLDRIAQLESLVERQNVYRTALRRLHYAVKALGKIGSNGINLFEDSPTRSQEAFEAWTELNGAQKGAAEALKIKLLFDGEWLREKIASDPDIETDAGAPITSTERTPE